MAQPLTDKQTFWLNHINAARDSGMSLSAYARQHNLKVHSLYSAAATLRRKNVLPEKAKPFVRVAVTSHPQERPASMPSRGAVQVFLPNGIRLALPALDEDLLARLLSL